MADEPVSIIITARHQGMDATPTLDALPPEITDIHLVGDIHHPNYPTYNTPNPASKGRNQAIQNAKHNIICFLDADCIPPPNWLHELTSSFANPISASDIIGVKGTFTTPQTTLIPRFVQVEYNGKYNRLTRQPKIDFIDTYCAAYRRDILLANGGFDERFPFLEDQELSFRLSARGYTLAFQPTATVTHHHVSTLPAYFTNKFSIGYWKAQVVRRFPHQSLADSHTPQTIKLQILLIALLGCTTLLGFFKPLAWSVSIASVLLFLLSCLPIMRDAAHTDPAVIPITPPLILTRALGLGFGYLWGLLRPIPNIVNTETTIGGINYIAKRLLDILGGLVGCTLLFLCLPIIALLIKTDSKGPIFFLQERIGQRGRPFKAVKFRTMTADAEAQLDDLIDVKSLSEPAFKLQNDPRITKVGRTLRRWSIDELPQFWNVLRGDMSLVGPRPEETRIVALYNDWHRRRLAVKPGITGPMQVGGRGDLSLTDRVTLEIEYIENYSIWRDIKILLQTFPAVFNGEGAR